MQEAKKGYTSFRFFNIKQNRNLKKILAFSLMIIICTMVLQPTMDAAAKKNGGGGGGGGNSGGNSGNSHADSNRKNNENPSDSSTSSGNTSGTSEPIGESSQSKKIDYFPGRLLVKFKDNTAENIQNAIIEAHGAKLQGTIKETDVKIIRLPEETIDSMQSSLETLPIIEYVQKDFFDQTQLGPTDQAVNSQEKEQGLIPGRYIVVLKDNVLDDISKAYGLTKIHEYKHALNGVAVKASPEQIEKLKKDSRILFIEQDRILTIDSQTLPTGINRAEADLSPLSKIDGIDERVDVDIAIIDTGIEKTHSDLNVAGGINFVGTDTTAWNDGHGHGTHVAGTTAALDNNIGVAGIAPGARLWGVKVISDTGAGTLIDVAEGIDWVTANSNIIDVANLSLGGSGSDDGNCGNTNGDALHKAICNSVAKGVVFVVSAGNSARDSSTQVPASYDEVITVSAIADFDGKAGGLGTPTCRTDVDDTFADFSNYGSDVDLAAPGVCILSAWKGGAYATLTGTSMSAPHVTGAAALYIAANGKPSNQDGVNSIKQSLIDIATPQSDPAGFKGDPDSFKEPLLNVKSINSQPPSQTHDVSISSLQIPLYINKGDKVTATVGASNLGTFDETFSVTLSDTTDSIIIGTQSLTLTSGQSSNLSFTFDTANSSEGNHVLSAMASQIPNDVNVSNNEKTSTTNIVTSDTLEPAVKISNPSDGSTVNGQVAIHVQASDSSAISKVEIFVGGKIKTTLTSEPYDYKWQSRSVKDGPATLSAIAYDTSGNKANDAVNIMVKNGK